MTGINPTLKPVSVIYVVGNLRTTGPIMQLLYLISNLDKSQFKAIVFVTSGEDYRTDIEVRLGEAGAKIVKLTKGKLASIFVAPNRLARVARSEPAVVVHPYGFRSDIICWLSRVRPRLGNVRNNLQYNYQRIFGHWIGTAVSAINLFFLRRTDIVVSCGTSVKQNLSGLGQDSVAIRNAIDPAIYRSIMCSASPPDRPRCNIPTYVTVASRIPGKNVEFLIEHFASAPTGSRRLEVIGQVDPMVVATYEDHPNIVFHGYVPTPGDILLQAHFFLSASEHEGMPNAVLESLILGRPVVLSEIPSHNEIFDVVGYDLGESFTWTSASLEAALRKIESHEYKELAARCQSAAKLHMGALDMTRRYQTVYRALVSETPRYAI